MKPRWLLTLVLPLCLVSLALADDKVDQKDLETGTWKVVAMNQGGKELPKEIPHRLGEIVKRDEFKRSWIAFQRAHFQSNPLKWVPSWVSYGILRPDVATSLEMYSELTNVL